MLTVRTHTSLDPDLLAEIARNQASNYNARPRAAEILVDDTGWRVVRFREALEDLWRGEIAG
jgi:hypothetical protein